MARKYTQEDFLRRVKEIHGDKLDFSEFEYNGNNKKGTCKCNVCGHIWQPIPMTLFKGHGCPKCAVEYKARKLSLSQLEVLEKFKKVHGDKYCYDNVQYKNLKTPVEIICSQHGAFMQAPGQHLLGHGCPRCANSGIRLTQEEFVRKMSQRYENIDFSEFNYRNATEEGKCRCQICGHEWTTTYVSLRSSIYGCPHCAVNARATKRASTLLEFIDKYHTRFPKAEYDFSDSCYTNALTKMDISCPKHGVFQMTPNDLLNGHGCPKCNQSQMEKSVEAALLSNKIPYVYQARFEWLGGLSLDFYLPEDKLAIECQGIQHFCPIDHFGGQEALVQTQERDERKRKSCVEHGVELLYLLDEEYNSCLTEGSQSFNTIKELVGYVRQRRNPEQGDY